MSDDQDIEQLQGDIEQTRGDLAKTIGQIEARLSPSALQDQVSEIVKQVTDQLLSEFQGKSGELTSKINDQVQTAVQSVATTRVEQLIGQAGPAVGSMGKSLWTRLSDNPAVGALAAVGIGLLAAEESVRRSGAFDSKTDTSGSEPVGSGSITLGANGLQARASDLAKEAAEAITGGLAAARQQGQGIVAKAPSKGPGGSSDQGGLGAMLSDQSLSSGLLGMGVGFLVGLIAPETEKERVAIAPLKGKVLDKAGEQLDQMGIGGSSGEGILDQVKRAGGDLLSQATQSASAAVDSGKQTANTVKQTVVETARQAASGDNTSDA